MITINLLRQSLADSRRLKRGRYWEGMIGLLALSVVSLVLGLVWVNADHRTRFLEQEAAAKRVQVASQTELESEVKALVDRKEQLTLGLLRLEDIQRLRAQPVEILDSVSRSLDPLDLWLVTMQLGKERLTLDGLAGSREEILRFSKNLDEQSLFKKVIISETRANLGAEEPLYSFSMNLKLDTRHVGTSPT